jgi:hypothetical protein
MKELRPRSDRAGGHGAAAEGNAQIRPHLCSSGGNGASTRWREARRG